MLPGSVYVVLGANASQIESAISSAMVIVNDQWQEGIGTSIACGVRHVDKQYQTVLVLLADQPLIQSEHLKSMLDAYIGGNIVCAKYRGARGVPAIFPESCFDQLKGLSGDNGAKRLLQTTQLPVIELDMPEASFYVDRVDDMSALHVHYNRR
ncbi:nucleotidyltransferase family protein [Porticoccaceae bacterium]|nr:nucleotidyltransferase family protein [Porticoccaceae bacterium]